MSGKIKENMVPASVALGILAIAAQSLGLLPHREDSKSIKDYGDRMVAVENRMTATEARQVELENRSRQDRNDFMNMLYEIKGTLGRIEGELKAK